MHPVGRAEDTRKVQTAVLGGPDGHLPLFLPYEKQAADLLRQKHGPNAFTCGTLLGGCGKPLTLRACDDKKSHFAHRPPVRCTRTALGADSADHLYIGEALAKWLRRQGQTSVQVQYVKQRNARSDTIEVRFGPQRKRRLIHVQMARRSFKDWQADGERLSAPPGRPATIRMYGPESQLAPFEVDAVGHALRFRCETENGTRVVYVGTHPPGHVVEWTTLDTCRLVPAGIVTPWLEETPYGIRPKGAAPERRPESGTGEGRKAATPLVAEPQGDGLHPGPVLPLMTGRVAFTRAALVSEEGGRGVYDVDAQPVGSTRFRARISLPASLAAPVPHHVYVLTDRATVLGAPRTAGPDSRWTLRAEGFVRLTPTKAAEWELLEPLVPTPTPAPAPEEDATASATPAPLRKAVPVGGADTQRSPSVRTPVPPHSIAARDDRLVAELTRVLVRTARSGATITWHELLGRIGVRPEEAGPARQLKLLTALDAPHAKANRPLLSSLITFSRQAQPNDVPPPFFRQVLLALGHPRWTDDARAADIWKAHRARVHRAHRGHAGEPAQDATTPGLPPARPGQDPSARLSAVLRHLDDTGAELATPALEQALKEADRLAALVGGPFLTDPVKERLGHWRTVMRKRLEQSVTTPSEARELFDRMADEFRAARDAGDLALAKRVRSGMGPLYALRLSPPDREAVTGLMREFKQWVRDQEPRTPADASLRALGALIQDLGTRRATLTTAELESRLAEADRLRRGLSVPLPDAQRKALRRWRGNLRHRQREESRAADPRSDEKATGATSDRGVEAPRLDREAVVSLADRIRPLLQDAARAGTTVTWGDLRRRMGGALPFLHPDDQGEVLVVVDQHTPPDEPLLSALVAGADLSPHGLYRHIRFSHGRERVPDASLEMHWRMEVLELFQLWRHR
ncbi:competence protein CoiA family protein [Streptomyces rochei]|uniref:competence protein CoiA family protein n=1 Tax=Streptomyces rochei TaxID=1928 RepID=UPI0036CA8E7A